MITTALYLILMPIWLYFTTSKNDWTMLLNDPKLFSLFFISYWLVAIVFALGDIFNKLKEINDNLSKGKGDDK